MDKRAFSDEETDIAAESETELLSFAKKMLNELEHCHAEQMPLDDGTDDDFFSDFDESARK